MKHLGTVELNTARLCLRKFTIADTDAMFENWASDPEVTKFLTWPAHQNEGVSRWVLESWLSEYEKENYYQWAIEYEGQPVGSISVVSVNDSVETVQIGYCIGKRWWHKGITSEALEAVIKFFFEEVGVNRVEARHDSNNPNSGAVMRKCGMKYEGTLRQSDRNNQGICDACWYSILRSEYFGR
jgi:ribosomal-protein-alanine N-acetyltransferase